MGSREGISEFRILGPLSVLRGDSEVAIGGGRQQALLAILLLHRGEPVSADRLADELWEGAPPLGAAKTLQVYVSRLRAVLGNHLVPRSGSGYRLQFEPEALDAARFERLTDEGRDQLAGGDAATAARTLGEALALWRGAALGDLAGEPFARAEAARLEELRLGALEERIEADLALGRHARLVSELRALVARHPHRERMCGQLMLALYRCDRQADALEAYRSFAGQLDGELGLVPGPALQALERRILNHDPGLGGSARSRPPAARPRRGALVVAACALVLAGGAAALALSRSSGGDATLAAAAPGSVGLIDARSNALVAQIPVGSGPSAVALGAGSAWVADAGDRTVARIDPATRRVVGRFGLGRIPGQLAFGDGALWVASAIGHRGVITRVDPDSETADASTTVRVGFGRGDDLFAPPTPSAVAAGGGRVWANSLHSRLSQLEPGRVRTFDLGAAHAVDGIAVGAGAVWVASGADDRVLRIDPRSGRVVAEIPIAGTPGGRLASPFGVDVGYGAVWVTDTLANTVSRIDPRLNAVSATIRVGRRPTHIAAGEHGVWVLNAGDGTVARIDPRRDRVRATVNVGGDVNGIAAGLGAVWVTVGGGALRPRVLPRSAGRALRPLAGCAAIAHGSGTPQLLLVSDLPTSINPPTPSPVIADARAAIRRVLELHHFRAGRFRLAYQACEDAKPGESPAPDRCAANGRAFAFDPSVIGVIGAWTSSCTGIELPSLNAARGGPIPMISPSNTYVGLTHVGPATAADEPERYYPTHVRNFVRLAGADDAQSAAIALFLREQGRRRVYVLDDGEGTGYAGAAYAVSAARRLGLTVAGQAVWHADAPGYQPLAERIARSGADAVVLSGCICASGPRLVRDLRRALGERVLLIGTDNFTFGGDAFRHAAFDGLYISIAGRPAETLPASGTRFLSGLRPRRPLRDIDPLVASTAEAAELMVAAIARSDGSRAAVVRELAIARDRRGILGDLAFDRDGDPLPAPIAIYRVDPRAPRLPHRGIQALVLDRVIEPPPALLE